MSETVITVRGESVDRFTPELASVAVEATVDGTVRQDVTSAATATSNALRDTITALQDPAAGSGRSPVTQWSADTLNVWSERPWNAEGAQLPLVFHARIGLTVQFSDFPALALWVQTILDIDTVTIHGIEWTLGADRLAAVTFDVRSRAVQDAVTKATAYATSLGLRTVQAVAIADPGMLGDGVGASGAAAGFRANAMMMKSAPAELAFSPRDIEVRAAVDARFLAS
jgi:uncharacterized protein YggE